MKNILIKLLTDERGQALPVVLIVLVMGGLMISPLLDHMSTGLNATKMHEQKLVELYSDDSAIDHAYWRLLYESGFANAMTPESPTVDYSTNINGRDVPVTITRLSGLGETGGLDLYADYVIPAGHILEFKVTVISDDHCNFAYDTEAYSAGVHIPTTSGNITYYLHNNPTPPTADTDAQTNLPMDETQPTATNFYNYDQNWDLDPGRKIEQSLGGPDGLELKEYQNWQTTPYASDIHIQGTLLVNLWAAPDGFNYDNEGDFWVFLRDYDPVSGTYTEIVNGNYHIGGGEWSGDWHEATSEGKYQIIATDGNTEIEAIIALGFGYLTIISFTY